MVTRRRGVGETKEAFGSSTPAASLSSPMVGPVPPSASGPQWQFERADKISKHSCLFTFRSSTFGQKTVDELPQAHHAFDYVALLPFTYASVRLIRMRGQQQGANGQFVIRIEFEDPNILASACKVAGSGASVASAETSGSAGNLSVLSKDIPNSFSFLIHGTWEREVIFKFVKLCVDHTRAGVEPDQVEDGKAPSLSVGGKKNFAGVALAAIQQSSTQPLSGLVPSASFAATSSERDPIARPFCVEKPNATAIIKAYTAQDYLQTGSKNLVAFSFKGWSGIHEMIGSELRPPSTWTATASFIFLLEHFGFSRAYFIFFASIGLKVAINMNADELLWIEFDPSSVDADAFRDFESTLLPMDPFFTYFSTISNYSLRFDLMHSFTCV
jgi:hypothetical protein